MLLCGCVVLLYFTWHDTHLHDPPMLYDLVSLVCHTPGTSSCTRSVLPHHHVLLTTTTYSLYYDVVWLTWYHHDVPPIYMTCVVVCCTRHTHVPILHVTTSPPHHHPHVSCTATSHDLSLVVSSGYLSSPHHDVPLIHVTPISTTLSSWHVSSSVSSSLHVLASTCTTTNVHRVPTTHSSWHALVLYSTRYLVVGMLY